MRLINAEALKEIIKERRTNIEKGHGIEVGFAIGMLLACEAIIDKQPTIKAKPIVRAHWNNDGRCTNCGGHAPFFPWTDEWYDTKLCPHCGAQMDELVSDTNKLNSSEKPNSCDHIAEGGKKENDEKEG